MEADSLLNLTSGINRVSIAIKLSVCWIGIETTGCLVKSIQLTRREAIMSTINIQQKILGEFILTSAVRQFTPMELTGFKPLPEILRKLVMSGSIRLR